MEKTNKRLELLGSVPIPKALLAIGVPTMVGMMISAIYNLVDAYFVGGLGTSPMGAIFVTYPLSQVVVGLGLLFGNGSASYISRLLGQEKREEAGRIASTAIYGGLAIGGLFILLTLIFLTPILRFLGATDSILPFATQYAAIFVSSSIFTIFNVMMNNIVSSEGASKISMFAMLFGAVLNMILDPVFITVLGFGITGAAIASAIGQAVSSLFFLYYILQKTSLFSFRICECHFSKKNISEIFKIGIPTLLFQIFTSFSTVLINNQAGKLTFLFGTSYVDSVIAGMGAQMRVMSMGALMVFGFIKGLQPIAGYSFGAGKFDRLREAIKTSILWSTAFCLVFGLISAIFSKNIISLFTDNDKTMIAIGSKSLTAAGFSFLLFGYYTVYSSLYLALGKGKEGFLLGACRQGFCFIPAILFLPALFSVNGILYAQPVADIVSVLIAFCMAFNLKKSIPSST